MPRGALLCMDMDMDMDMDMGMGMVVYYAEYWGAGCCECDRVRQAAARRPQL